MVQLPYSGGPFKKIKNPGSSITIDTAGKVLVIPTGNSSYLPSFNEYVLNSNRLTVAESPFEGLKGSGSPDYGVGTIYINSGDGVYLNDINGNNSTKTLTAGKLKEVNSLTVDTSTKTITEEFIITNTNIENGTPLIIDDCSNASSWGQIYGTVTEKVIDTGFIKITGTADGNGRLVVGKTISAKNLTNYPFVSVQMKGSVGTAYFLLGSDTVPDNFKYWTGSKFSLQSAGGKFLGAVNAPLGSNGSNPTTTQGTLNLTNIVYVRIGVTGVSGTVTFYFNDFKADVGKGCYLEINTPDNLADTSLQVYAWDTTLGTPAYASFATVKLDSAASLVSTITVNSKYLDGTALNDVYGITGGGRGFYPKSYAGQTVAGNYNYTAATLQYSANKGTKYRIGLGFLLAPSDGGRTSLNKIRLKLVIYYTDANGNTIPDVSGYGNTGTITGGVTKLSSGFKFDGVNGAIAIGKPSSLNLTSAITISALVKPDAVNGHRVILFDSLADNNIPIELEIQEGIPKFVSFINGTATLRAAGTAIAAGNTVRITATFDSSLETEAGKMFQGSSKTGTTNVRDLIPSRTGSLNIGYYSASYIFSGTIYDVQIWNRALSQSEITALNNVQDIPAGQVLCYKFNAVNSGYTNYEFEDSLNASYGLQNMSKPFIALYDPAGNYIDFFLFTHRPKNLTRKRDDSGNIYEITLYQGNGSIYRGRITNANLTIDSDSNLIPNCLESSIEGSVTKFLACYGMVI